MKAKCCPNTSIRKIARSVHEAARDVARRIAATPEYVRSRHERKKVEMLFAHLKRILKLDHSQATLNEVARQLNSRPRKTLNYETPAERFSQSVASTG